MDKTTAKYFIELIGLLKNSDLFPSPGTEHIRFDRLDEIELQIRIDSGLKLKSE